MAHLQCSFAKHENERILFFSRRHILILIMHLFVSFVILFVLITIFIVFLQHINFFLANIFFVLLLLWQVLEIFSDIYCHYATFLVITDHRVYAQKAKHIIVDIFVDTFSESLEMFAIRGIDDSQSNIFQLLFHFGKIHIAASGVSHFTFENIPYPEDVGLYLDKIVALIVTKKVASDTLPVFIHSKQEFLALKHKQHEQFSKQ